MLGRLAVCSPAGAQKAGWQPLASLLKVALLRYDVQTWNGMARLEDLQGAAPQKGAQKAGWQPLASLPKAALL